MTKAPFEPVFGFLADRPGTTLVHLTRDGETTLCGLDCGEWYGDGDLAVEDVECKRCKALAKGQSND